MSKETIQLSDQEATILRDIFFARNMVLKLGENIEVLPVCFSESKVRQMLPAFDFFHSTITGNEVAVKRMAAVQKELDHPNGCEYYEDMIDDY